MMVGHQKALTIASATVASLCLTINCFANKFPDQPEIQNSYYKLWSNCELENAKYHANVGANDPDRVITHKREANIGFYFANRTTSGTSSNVAHRQRFTIIYDKPTRKYWLSDSYSFECFATDDGNPQLSSRPCLDVLDQRDWDIVNVSGTPYYRIFAFFDDRKAIGLKHGNISEGTPIKVGNANSTAMDQQWYISCKNDGLSL